MGVFKRTDSKYWWLWLEAAPVGQQKERTQILMGETRAERTDSRRLAERVYIERMHALGSRRHNIAPPRQNIPTFQRFAQWYDLNVAAHHRGKEREREILHRLTQWLGTYRLHEIDPAVVREYRTYRLTTSTVIEHFGGPRGPRRVLPPPAARTVNREVDVLQQVLAAAVPTHFDKSPLDGFADLEVVPPVRRTMSQEEEERLLRELALDDRAIFICAIDTLSRLSDVLDLQHADDGGDLLTIRQSKNGELHTVPVSARLRAALDALPRNATEWLFPRRRAAKTERDRRTGYAHALQRACLRAKVPYGRARRGITFHWATRRTGATRMIRAGGDRAIATTQRIGNWKDPSVLIGIYQETITAEMRAAVEAVSAKHAGVTPGILPHASKPLKNRRKSA